MSEEQLCPMRRSPTTFASRTVVAAPQGSAGPPAAACRAAPSHSGSSVPLPSDPVERVLLLVLRCLAAAGETGDAVCWDEALDRAEQAFGPRDGTLVVARAAALHRSLARSGSSPRFLPLPCRRLSGGEAELLHLFRASVGNPNRFDAEAPPAASRLSADTRMALADVVDAVRSNRSAVLGLRPAA